MYESNFYAIRKPLLSLGKLFEFYEFTKTNDDKEILNYLIKQFLENYQLKEALYLASNILYSETIKFSETPGNFSDKDRKKLLHSLTKYYIRSASRCTPFGLFANFGQGIYEEPAEDKETPGRLQYFPRIDMEVQYQIGDYISKLEGIDKFLTYQINNSLYKAGGAYRYVEYRLKKTIRTHHLVSLEYNEVLAFIIKESRTAIKYDLLIEKLFNKYEASKEDLEHYVNGLILNKLLISNLDINVSGTDYYDLLIKFLTSISKEEMSDKVSEARDILLKIKDLLLKVSDQQSNIEFYKEIHTHITSILPGIPEKNLIQLDVINPEDDNTISIDKKNELESLTNIVSKFAILPSQNSQFEVFKRAFKERYDNKKVKLAEALDGELGLGYKSARSLRDFYDNGKKNDKNKLTTFVLYKYHEYLKLNKDQINIDEADVKKHFDSIESANIPHINFFLKVYPTKDEDLIYISSLSSSLGNNLMGRFCSSHNGAYDNLSKLIYEYEEQNKDYIYAEIVHLPQARAGNVIARPHFGQYEIPYLSNSLLSEKQKIYIDDLYIQIINNELFLFSSKLKKPIKPRLSNAHNFSGNSLPIYNFLCDVQFQNSHFIRMWDWGIIEEVEEFFPRVVFKNYVLEPAKWIIKNEKFAELKKCKKDYEFKQKLQTIKNDLGISDLVIQKEGDNTICLDISTSLGVDMLWNLIDKRDSYIVLYESLFENIDSLGSTLHHKEIILPFIRKNKKDISSKIISKNILNTKRDYNKRIFTPGSNWIYFKVYTDFKFVNKVLLKLGNCIEHKFIKNGIVEKWFFIRYSDPKQHLRFRIYINDIKSLSLIMEECNRALEPFIKSGGVSNIIQDTYVRELERYGDKNIISSETLFYYDSALIYRIYKYGKNLGTSDLFFIGYYLTENYLHLSELNEEVLLSFLEKQFNYYAKEFDYLKDKALRNALHDEQRRIKDIIIEEKINENILKLIKNSNMKEVIDQVQGNGQYNYLSLLSSYIHMTVNRFFIENQRFNEFKIYFFLLKKYQSVKARKLAKV